MSKNKLNRILQMINQPDELSFQVDKRVKEVMRGDTKPTLIVSEPTKGTKPTRSLIEVEDILILCSRNDVGSVGTSNSTLVSFPI
jgi:hypothetical protein